MKDLSKNPRQFNYVDPTLYEMGITTPFDKKGRLCTALIVNGYSPDEVRNIFLLELIEDNTKFWTSILINKDTGEEIQDRCLLLFRTKKLHIEAAAMDHVSSVLQMIRHIEDELDADISTLDEKTTLRFLENVKS